MQLGKNVNRFCECNNELRFKNLSNIVLTVEKQGVFTHTLHPVSLTFSKIGECQVCCVLLLRQLRIRERNRK